MARIRTVDFLPEIFKTDVNREFLGATLDQLVQEPELKRVQGYIGRRFGPGTRYNDSYVLEPTAIRSNYQFEPAVVINDENGNSVDAITYPGIIDALSVAGANVTRHDRLFASETYSWDPSINFDKFINYGQYYWLPAGPDAVNVQSTAIAITDDFVVTETESDQYNISGTAGNNPTITLVRGGSYTFAVTQDSPFWIQAEAGVDGTFDYAPNISSRNVLGVLNNGANNGVVTFSVPKADAQQVYHDMPVLANVNLATTERFDSINRKFVADFAGIDGIKDLEGKTLVFLQDQPGDSYDLGWQREGQFDNDLYGQYGIEFEPTTYLDTQAERYSLFTITYVRPDGSSDEGMYIELVATQTIDNLTQFTIGYGTEYSNRTFYKNASGYFAEQPLLTAANDVLYYQDGTTTNKFGVIKLVDAEGAQELNVTEDILGQPTYISPNGITFTNGLKVVFRGNVLPDTYTNNEYYVEGVGDAITLTPVSDLVCPEEFYNNVEGTINQPQAIDYITINRSSIDRNHWSRSNRWFHVDVINKTADYNNTVPTFDNDYRAKRPIIEFDANLKLFNTGTQAVNPIDVIDFATTDALSLVHGSSGYSVDGYRLTNGSRVVFANDSDPLVRNKIYQVSLVDPDDDSTEYGTIVNLQLADDAEILENQVVYCESGNTQAGQQYQYINDTWSLCQDKTAVNQAPLFDIFDNNGYSFGNTAIYPSTSFAGSKLFSYKVGSTVAVDPVLGFSLSYENIDNIGDIVFESNQYTDTFVYVADTTSTVKSVSDGFTRSYTDRTTYTSGCGWVTSVDKNWQRQVFTFQYDGSTPLTTDIPARTDLTIPAVKVYVENEFVNPSTYSVTNNGEQTSVTFNSSSSVNTNDIVQVKIISDQASSVAYYEVPSNLDSNIFNQDNETFTLGTIRNHYNRLVENVVGFTGNTNGINNSRDVGNLPTYGDVIVQHSSPLAPAAFFLRNHEYDFFNALERSARDYQNFKNQILNWVNTNDIFGMTASQILDAALADINVGKTDDTVYYWEDMLPFGGDYVENSNVVSVISTRNYTLSNIYNFESANTRGLLVYHNDVLLLKDTDYTVATDGPRITLTFDPAIGDTIVIREYETTYGSFVPPTPTKLGLYLEKDPEIYTDETYVNPQIVIQGHDGSVTIGFGDERDNVLLEFERRIYNNLKHEGNETPIRPADIFPGEFRNTEYTLAETTEILAESFLDWCGWNKIDYKTQDYRSDNEWTWNYSTATCTIDGSLLPGHWRGIYVKYYDTDRPHTHPWELLGIRDEPSWWSTHYGPAPYTSGNLVMWEDLEAGYNRNTDTYDIRYARPRLTEIIPVDTEGNLQSPMATLVANYNSLDFRKSWNFGDGGPAETAWRRSSAFPFAMQKLYALTKPAEYFALMADRDQYKWSDVVGQYVYNDRYRYDFRDVEVADIDVFKHSYINWIVEAQRDTGIVSPTAMTSLISDIDVRLTYRLGGFSGKNYLKVYTDKSSPDSSNTSLIVPDESYQLLLYKNQAFTNVQYSSVMIQKVAGGYAVYGNSQSEAFFRILKSANTNDFTTFYMGDSAYRLPKQFTDTVVRVPYGYSFTNKNSVIDFLMSYGAYLQSQGLVFEDRENNYALDWGRMANEFAYWAEQGWDDGALININPAANVLEFERERSVVDDLNNLAVNEMPLDQNRTPMTGRDYAVTRLGNRFKITGLTNKSLSYLRVRATSYEHMLILNNRSIFNDLMYDPTTGLRQLRIRVDGYKTANWEGQLNARGFILNQDNVPVWKANRAYNKGDLVEYKNSYWAAAEKLQPMETFDFEYWSKVDYDMISQGLLPNIANKADQISKYYNNRVANLESDADLLSLGLTGFRKRDYLESLNLDDISQVAVYQNLVENKGTPATVELFQNVEFDKETSDYQVFENWAVKRAAYGASDNKRFVEVELDNTYLRSNPSVIEIGNSLTTTADQLVYINDIYKQSNKNTNTNIFPELTEELTDTVLPTAGFVNRDDVDIAMFSLNDLTEIDNNLDLVQDGAYVWVARKNTYDWDVYRCTAIEPNDLTIIDNLNGTMSITFDSDHGLIKGGILIVTSFNDLVDGAYRVQTVNDIRTVTVEGNLPSSTTSVTDNAIAFKLETARLEQAKDLVNASYVGNLFAGDKIWVNSDTNGYWKVYEKHEPFVSSASQTPAGASSNIGFGTSIAQGLSNTGLLVGAPAHTSTKAATTGGLFCYNKDSNDYRYVETISNVNEVEEYGSSISFATNWAVAGAPGTKGQYTTDFGAAIVIYRNPAQNLYQEYQVLTAPTGDHISVDKRFGEQVIVSEDENWIYVSSPSSSDVYGYQKIIYQTQLATFVTDGNTASYNLDNLVKVDTKDQVTVTVDDTVLPTSAYNLTSNNLIISDVPAAGSIVEIERRDQISATGDGSTVAFTHVEKLYTATDLESFQVYVDGVLMRPTYDYTYAADTVTFATAPADGAGITFRAADYYKYKFTINSSDNAGAAIATTADGQQIYIGKDEYTASGLTNAGGVEVHERAVERFVVINPTQRTYVATRQLDSDAMVHVNEVHLLNSNYSVGLGQTYTINTTANTVTFDDEVELNIGDIVDIDVDVRNEVQTLTLDNVNQGARFGSTISVCRTDCSVYIGAPDDNWILPSAGSVSRFLNASRVYGTVTGTIANPTLTPTDTIRIDNIDVTITGTSVAEAADDINNATIPNVQASVTDGKLTISLINVNEAPVLSKLTIMPGLGTAFADLGLEPFANVQTIRSPVEREYARFGSSIHVDYSAINLVVGAERGHIQLPTEIDATHDTSFDRRITRFVDPIVESGAVYSYDLLPSSSVTEAGSFVFGQQIYDEYVNELDQFGYAVDYTEGLLVVASTGYDTAVENIGRIATFANTEQQPAWKVIQSEPTVVDARKANRCYIYDKKSLGVLEYLDFIDPINGKLLGVVRENLDYITPLDPAVYNDAGKKNGVAWTNSHVGQLWWNTDQIRYNNYNQQDVKYASKTWGTLFPGSSVDVYEWVESEVPPAEYVGEVKSVDEYSTLTGIDQTRTITTRYYFWAKNTTTVSTERNKTLSANTIAEYIEYPLASGIPFAALMRKNVIAVYNVSDYLQDDKNSVLHIEYNQTLVDNNVFVEYDLVKANDPSDFMSDQIWRKMKDSLCGADSLGNIVPDYTLSSTDKYGVSFRPRQSMFIDRFAALKTFLTRANEILLMQPFSELRTFNLLVAQEAEPLSGTGAWDSRVSDITELSYQNTFVDGVGYKYLVEVDENNNGLWTIYTVQTDFSLSLTRVQSYDTSKYWSYTNWYANGYSNLTKPARIVDTYSELLTLTEKDGTVVKVSTNSDNKWELYVYDSPSNTWSRIALQDGTIQLSAALYDYSVNNNGWDAEVFDIQYFDEEPTRELRNVLEALAFEILVGDFILYRNQLMITAFNYILFEQGTTDWLYKTSLIDVSHKVRNLDQYPVYRKDNQDFVLNYIYETKPYHVQLKEFLTRYEGIDTVGGNVYDFDNPSAYDATYSKFISPVLEDNVAVLETDVSNRTADSSVWETHPWSVWYDNRLSTVDSVVVYNSGTGYTVAPQVTFTGEATTQATGVATINELGEVSGITVTNPGSGYRATPLITISGGNGTGAQAAAITKHDTVRTLKTTIKYDRYEYDSVIVDWEANTVYNTNDLVRYNDRVYMAVNADGSTPSEDTFNPSDYTLVSASELSGINRTAGYYVADVNKPGLDLALLINGLDYPMVQLKGPGFEYNSGYDVGNYDLTVFDNIEYGPEGLPTYSEAILDNEIFTSFTGSYPGVDLSGIESVQATAISGVISYEVTSITPVEIGKGYSADVPPTVVIAEPRDNLTAAAAALTDGNEVTSITVTSEGFGYLSAPTVTIQEQSPTTGVQATATSEITAGSVTGTIITVAGSGYESAPSVTFSDPPSVGTARATAEVTSFDGYGNVLTVAITNQGSAYTTPPAVTVTDPPSSVTATGEIALVGSTYKVQTTGTLTEAGNYYSVAPTVTVEAPTATAIQATASATIGGGSVTEISVDNPGHMYQTAPTVTITPASPTAGINAAATATLDNTYTGFDAVDSSGDGFDAIAFDTEGGIGNINITVPGSGYTVAPVVTISAPDITGGTQATATATISGDTDPLYTGDGYVVSITVTEPGTGYTSAPTVSIAAPDSVINHGVGASATATISDTDVIDITINSGGSYYDITPTITLDAPTTPYTATVVASVSNGRVTSLTTTDQGWGYETAPALTIADPDITPVTAAFTAVLTGDAVTSLTIDEDGAGYLTAPTITIAADPAIANDIATGTAVLSDDGVASITITNAGANYSVAPSITIGAPTGQAFHGSGATATATLNPGSSVATIVITNPGTGYDLAPDVIISAPTRTTRRATAEPVITGGGVVSYTITDPGIGYITAPVVTVGTPSDVDPDADIMGGGFVDTYNSHAPEELIPGAIFDTLDMRVYTRPGFDYTQNGHGWEVKSVERYYQSAGNDLYWNNLIDYPASIVVFNSTTGVRLYEDVNYTIDWVNKTIDVTSGALSGQSIKIFVYGYGGGNQLYRYATTGNLLTGNQLSVPVNVDDVNSMLILVNGEEITSYSYVEGEFASQTSITFTESYNETDYISIVAFADNPSEDSTIVDLTYSYPVTEVFTCDGSTNEFTIAADVDFSGRENLIVEHNGVRLQPPAGRRHIGDTSTGTYELPDGDRTGIDLDIVVDDEVAVYVDGIRQESGVDYQLDPADGSSYRTVTFLTNLPDNDQVIDVYVTKTDGEEVDGIPQPPYARYWVGTGDSSQTLTIVTGLGLTLSAGDTIAVTSWIDTREQDPLTQVFKGPVIVTQATRELWDQFGFDLDLWDRISGTQSVANLFDLDRAISNSDRIWVTLNGNRLNASTDYSLSDNGLTLTIAGAGLKETDKVVITSFTNSLVPDSLGFRIFKDMRDNVGIYRILDTTQTKLVRDLKWIDDVIYVEDASKLGEPNLDAAIFGIVTINGERITYRNRDTVNNTISGLRRGTAGTGMHRTHAVDSIVSDIGAGEMYQPSYPAAIKWEKDTEYTAGTIVKFRNIYYRAKVNVPVAYGDTDVFDDDYLYPTVTVFDTTYWEVYDETWYNQGSTTATDGVSLQQTDSVAANFFKGN